MNLFPSPPCSPGSIASDLYEGDHNNNNHHHHPSSSSSAAGKVFCGSCDKPLSSDWFCADCHQKCATCNRFLSAGDHCTRCWAFDRQHSTFVRKQSISPPSPSYSTY
ncbi:hypothetical protein BX666DRAFT_397057 [Dichotomocladium elegans]|nr:hypothetical protein BX666DRAFT_397057 [Dichotomocladium elegans]